VKFSANAGFAAVLVLSLTGKLLANVAPPGPDTRLFDGAAVTMLRDAGFTVSVEKRGFGTLLHGRSGACALILTEYEPHGTFAQRYGELAAPVGPLRFAWHGRVYDKAPKAEALVGFYLWRELRRLALSAARRPLTAWAATPDCDTSHVDWGRVGSVAA
jgi:hypothetical protein